MENKRIEGKITGKKPYSGNSENGPKGNFYIGDDKFACWDESFTKFNVGDEVAIDYSEKGNEYNGKTYINRNISHIESPNKTLDDKDIRFNEEEKKELEKVGADTSNLKEPSDELTAGTVKISGFTYQIVLRLIK